MIDEDTNGVHATEGMAGSTALLLEERKEIEEITGRYDENTHTKPFSLMDARLCSRIVVAEAPRCLGGHTFCR